MGDVQETDLPGIGKRFDFETSSGARVGVIVHRTGRRDLLLYSRDDPDSCQTVLALSDADVLTLVEILGGSRITAHLTAVQQEIEGLAIDWIDVDDSSRWAGKTLAEAAVHTRTGVSIVAIMRADETVPAPAADTELLPGDRVVAVGTPQGLSQLAQELSGT
ncbi:MAG: potassium transporter TrkA [Acidimicrobiia bacterium]|nr:MAG: potassium transporter TrkA [Acidimicrobiia bacterium]